MFYQIVNKELQHEARCSEQQLEKAHWVCDIERATIKKGVGDLLDVFVGTKPLPTIVASFPGLPAPPPVQAIKNWRQEGLGTRLVACYHIRCP